MQKHSIYIMKIYRIINRYYLIINKIKNSYFPSFEEIQNHLADHDIEISLRTMQRDLQNIRYEFGIEVTYTKAQNGYYIDSENSEDYEYFMRFFEMTVMSGKLTEGLKDKSDFKKYISLEKEGLTSGVEYISQIMYALKEKINIRVKYHRFSDDYDFDAHIAPGFIKEYLKRWYVIGWNYDLKAYRIYALDRVKNIELTGVHYKDDVIEDCREMFDSVIGVSSPESKPELIELAFDPDQGKYIKSLPLHHSQTVLTDNDEEFRILIKVVPNYELIQLILSHRERVEVINPKWLRDEIKGICRKIANR